MNNLLFLLIQSDHIVQAVDQVLQISELAGVVREICPVSCWQS